MEGKGRIVIKTTHKATERNKRTRNEKRLISDTDKIIKQFALIGDV